MSDDEGSDDGDRYAELLEELRTVIPGAQVLFAFLLTVPFASRFDELDALARRVYAGALIGVAVALVLFLTPSAVHRVRQGDARREAVRLGVRLTITAMALLAVAVSAVVFVVIRLVFDHTVLGAAFAGVTLSVASACWFMLPAARR